jgi:hypothetical protein
VYTVAYIHLEAGMVRVAKVFRSGDSQAVRLPKARGLTLVTAAAGAFAGVEGLRVEDWSAE